MFANYDELDSTPLERTGICNWAKDMHDIEDCIYEVEQGLEATQQEWWWLPIVSWEWWFQLNLVPLFHYCAEFAIPVKVFDGQNRCENCPLYQADVCGVLIQNDIPEDDKTYLQWLYEACLSPEPDTTLMLVCLNQILEAMRENQY